MAYAPVGLGAISLTNPYYKPMLDALARGDCAFNYGSYALIPDLPQSPPACWFLDPANQQFQPRIVRATQDPARLAGLIESNWAVWTRYGDPEWFRVGDASDLDAPWTDSTLYNWTTADFLIHAPPSMIAAWKAGAGGRGMPPQLQNWVKSPVTGEATGPSLEEQAAAASASTAAYVAERDALKDLIDRVIPATFGQWQNALLAVNQPTGPVANQVLQILADFAAKMNARYNALISSGVATGNPVPAPPAFPYELVPNAPTVTQLSPIAGDVVPGSAVPVDYGTLPPGSVPSSSTPPEAIPPSWQTSVPAPTITPRPSTQIVQTPSGPVEVGTMQQAGTGGGLGLMLAAGAALLLFAIPAKRKRR